MIKSKFTIAHQKVIADTQDNLLDNIRKRNIGFGDSVLACSETDILKTIFLGEIAVANVTTADGAKLVLPANISAAQIDRFISKIYQQ